MNGIGREPEGPTFLVRRTLWLGVAIGVLVLCFSQPLLEWVRLALGNSLYSHALVIPFISGYLLWLKKGAFAHARPTMPIALLLPTIAVVLASGYLWTQRSSLPMENRDVVALMIFSFVLCMMSAFLLSFGVGTAKQVILPLGLLCFMVPFPQVVEFGIELFFQHTSADVAYLMIQASNIPVLREGLIFHLPGISLHVAPECSGIRSSLILFITSLVAGHFFLKNPWHKALLVFAVIPLAVVRNAVRIATFANLSVHVSPEMIHSPLHSHGGPLFFAISLIPFVILLVVIRRRETKS